MHFLNLTIAPMTSLAILFKSTFFVFWFKVDVAVLEVGLGGKYDATNVVRDILLSNNEWQYIYMA